MGRRSGRISDTATYSLKKLFVATVLIGTGAGIFAMMLRHDFAPGPLWILFLTASIAGGLIGSGIGVLDKMHVLPWMIVGLLLGPIGTFVVLYYALSMVGV